MKQNKNSRLDMEHGGQVNRHLGWVRLFCFFSSVALVVARWEHVTPSVLAAGLSRHALCRAKCAVAPSAVTAPHRSEKHRKTQSIIVFQAEKPVWIFVTGDDSTIRMRSESRGKKRGATLFTGPLAGRTAPNHRHNPGPHCYAIPALKRLYAVPVRLAQHYHTIAHALRHVWLCSHTHECSPAAGGRKKTQQRTTASTGAAVNGPRIAQQVSPALCVHTELLIVCSQVKARNSVNQTCFTSGWCCNVVALFFFLFFFGARGAKPGSRLT